MNPERFGTGFVLPFIHRWTNPQQKRSGLVASPEILNPEFKVRTLYPNTFESGKFLQCKRFFSKSEYFPPVFSYFFGKVFTLLKMLSQLKRLTSCGYLHLVTDSGSLQSLCSYSRLLITIHYYFRCLLRRRRTDPGS